MQVPGGLNAGMMGGAALNLGVNFDGTNDYLTRGAGMTGAADGKQITISFWLKRGATGSSQNPLAAETGLNDTQVFINNSDQIRFQGAAAGGGSFVLDINSSALADTASWHHIAMSVDMADTLKRHIYIDGASDLATVTTYTNANIDFTATEWSLGAYLAGSNKVNGDLYDFWLNLGYLDLSVAANLQKFRSSGGSPVNLGIDGSIPTGSSPLIYNRVLAGGAAVDFGTNQGTGGGWTVNGTLALSATNPT